MINDEIREITRRFVEALHPEKVILFGSYAKDTYREDSDYDFYIVMPDETDDILGMEKAAYKALRNMNRKTPIDILMNTKSKFANRVTRPTMEHEADRDGVVLYG